MSNILDSESQGDQQRLREILERSRMGLTEDLDDLRGELAAELEQFDSRLQKLARQLPPWLDLPDDSLRSPFELDAPARLEGSLIGPRTVAELAGDLEEFIFEWLDGDDEIPAWHQRNDTAAIDQLAEDLTVIRDNTVAGLEAVDRLADDGPLQLEQILESIVFELESQRETDVEALESLIQDGDVEPGRNARAEIAELWEEQRGRVDQLRQIWDDLLNLHYEGITTTIEGLEEIAQLLERTREGIRGAEIGAGTALDEPDHSEPRQLSLETAEQTSNRQQKRTPESSPAPGRTDSATSPDEEPRRFLRDSASQSASEEASTGDDDEASDTDVDVAMATEPIATEADDSPDELTSTTTTTLEDFDGDSPPDEKLDDHLDDEGGPTEPMGDTAAVAPTPQPPSPAPNNPPETSQPPQTQRGQSTDTEPSTSNAASPTSDTGPSTSPSTIDESRASRRQTNTPEDTAHSSSEEPEPPSDDQRSVRVRLFRTRPGWRMIGVDEIAATLGLATLFVGGLAVMSLLSLVDLTPNPMTTWDWALPASFAAMGLLVALPLLFGWRPMWSGTRFRVLRRGLIEEETDLQLTDDRLVIDRTSWPLENLTDTRLRRVESANGAHRGCLLAITPRYHSEVHLVSAADIDASNIVTTDDVPGDAWQIPPGEFELLCEAVEATAD